MKRRGCSRSTSAAIEDMKEFMDYQLELFKFETEEMLEQMINQVKELAAEDSAKKRIKKKAERTAGQAQKERSPQSEAEHQKSGSISSKNEGENEKEIEDAGIEDLSSVKGRRKSRRTIKEPAWIKDFMTV